MTTRRVTMIVASVVSVLAVRWGYRGSERFLRSIAVRQLSEVALVRTSPDNEPVEINQGEINRVAAPAAIIPAGSEIVDVYFSRTRPISNLASLARIPEVENIDAEGLPISEISPLRHCIRLRRLNLRQTLVRDIRPLSSLKSLEVLDLGESPIHDISGADGMTSLRTLNLMRTQVRDLSSVSKNENLQTINLCGCPVENLLPLSGLKGLRRVNLAHTNVRSIQALATCYGLESLNLRTLKVGSIEPLSSLPRLRQLDIRGLDISALSELMALSSLENLTIDVPSGSDGDQVLQAISGMHRLNYIDVRFASTVSPGQLRDIGHIKTVVLRGAIDDPGVLEELVDAVEIDVSDSTVDVLPNLSRMTHLRKLVVSARRFDSILRRDFRPLWVAPNTKEVRFSREKTDYPEESY